MRISGPGRHTAALAAALLLALTGCGATDGRSATAPGPTAARTPSDTATAATSPTTPGPTVSKVPTATPRTPPPPCDPGGGFPRARNGCPDPTPETGWLTRQRDGRLVLEPFRTYGDDAAGRAYARQHGLGFPFPNDYLDVPAGRAYALELGPATVCTGIVLVRHKGPLGDHVVACAALLDVAARQRVPVAVWRHGASVVQVSELYRP